MSSSGSRKQITDGERFFDEFTEFVNEYDGTHYTPDQLLKELNLPQDRKPAKKSLAAAGK